LSQALQVAKRSFLLNRFGDYHRMTVDDSKLKSGLKGLLLFRLLLGIFFLVLTFAAQGQRTADLTSADFHPLYYFSLILLLFTVFGALCLERVQHLRRFAYLQLFFDVEAVTALIYLSGGVESIFSVLYTPVIISAAILLYRRGSLVIASVCTVSYGLLLDLQYFAWIDPLQVRSAGVQPRESGTYFFTLLISTAGFYLVAYLCGYLAEEVQRSSRQIRENRRDFHKLEFLHRNILESLNSGLLTVSPSGHVLLSNMAAQGILALPSEQIDGRPFKTIFPTLDSRSWPSVEALDELGPPNILERQELFYRRPAGEEICLGYTLSSLRKEDGKSWGWVFIFQDLTHVKAMEDHLKRMERMGFAGKIAAEIAHEIKNPLAAISGAVQMLQLDLSQETFHTKLMNILTREITRIDELVTNFLWLARGPQKSQSGKGVSVAGVVEEVVTELKAKGKLSNEHSIEIELECNPTFFMDRNYLRQLLWHPMLNALEAMPEGGALTIHIADASQNRDRTETMIQISDTGCGISRELRERVFEPFYTTKSARGGLGLSIVFQLMQNVGGRIEIDPEALPGTTLSLFFPF
jgi:two-component system, NtrC family, sensor histidine kinase PilS